MLNKFRVNIGLEIHAQLASRTKLFSPAPVLDDAPPNSTVNIFDCATPGTLPVLNRECVMMALKAAKILNCEIPKYSRFDRKHYFYPDMPMGFQITQQEMPIAKNGFFDFYLYSKLAKEQPSNNDNSLNEENSNFKKGRVLVKQVQLEMDSGKTIVDSKNRYLIDLNRAGVGLIEIVTLPSLSSSLEAVSFLEQLRIFLIQNNISKGEMHKGHFRVDANISLIEKDAPENLFGERTEVKNINSFKDIHRAIDFEIMRHAKLLSNGERINYETRKICEDGKTVPLRDKEGEIVDYRFTAEPNLPLLKIEKDWLDCVSKTIKIDNIPHLIYINNYGMDPKLSMEFTNDKVSKNFMDLALSLNSAPISYFLEWYRELRHICVKIKQEYPLKSNDDIQKFCYVVNLENEGKITKLTGVELLKNCLFKSEINEEGVIEIINSNNLWRIVDEEEINYYINKVCEKEENLYKRLKREKKSKNFNKLRNLILNESNKTIELSDLEKLLWKKIDS
uniref:Glutamyl-tRNA(Gln) amidotransferase subunit B, mitochondrial n=1 Tax=Strongyloides venezuelensis TaxID=75913 RepID=A0A0K0FLF5_STRVS